MQEFRQKALRDLEILRNQGYSYSLERYVDSLSELIVRASKPDSPNHFIRIYFQTTIYIQMPIHWISGDFCLATTDRHKELTTSLGLDEIQARQLILLTVQPPTRPEILVLCHQVFLSQEIPISGLSAIKK